jgi:hypothetical protein
MLSSASPGIYLGHHRVILDGDRRTSVKDRGVVPTQGDLQKPTQPKAAVSIKCERWYYHANTIVNIANDYIHDLYHEAKLPGKLWTGDCDNAAHRSQRLTVKPLKSSDWPSDTLGPSWPSFPTITEWLEMCRKGIDPFARRELDAPEGYMGLTRVSSGEIKENPYLARKIVSNYVVGIRSSVEVPRKFRSYFRYRQGFLILTGYYCLPIGLVRFLLGQWITNPFSLWLRRAVRFKIFLRQVPTSLVKQAERQLAAAYSKQALAEQEYCTYSSDDGYDSESYTSSALD